MARYVHEGNTKVLWVTTIADIAAPTVAELTAGTDISELLTKDGLTLPDTQNMVDSATLADTFDAQVVGSWGGGASLTGFRDDTTDTLWDLAVYGTNGYIVVRRGMPYDDAIAAGQDVEVYPAEMHEPVMNQTGANEQARFTLALAVTGQPNKRAAVAV